MFTRLVNICQTQMPQWWDKRCFLQTSPRWRRFVKPLVVKIGSNLPADLIRANVRMMPLFRTIDNVQTEKASTGISSQPQQFGKWHNSCSFRQRLCPWTPWQAIQKGSLVNTSKRKTSHGFLLPKYAKCKLSPFHSAMKAIKSKNTILTERWTAGIFQHRM